MTRKLTTKDQWHLDSLNSAVKQAIKNRTNWLDQKMVEISDFKVGDEIYNLDTGELLGHVSEHYRYHAKQHPEYDTSPYCDIRYKELNSGNCFDNTSRQIGLTYGTKAQLKAKR